MKILQINAVSGIRSTGRTSVEIADYLNNNGHEGYIAYSEGVKYTKSYKIGSALEKKMHGLLSRIFGLQGYFSIRGTKKLIRYIKTIRPDVIHLRNLHANYINISMILKHISDEDIPTVITLHDCWFYTGKCTYYTVDNCYKWKTGCNKCPRLRKDNPSWLFDRTSKMYSDKKELINAIPRLAVVGVSDWITNEAKMSFLSSAKIIKKIYNWIDLEVFKPVFLNDIRQKLNLKGKFVILGVASIWNNEKGIQEFLELSKMIPQDMRILLIGNIDKRINLPSNIIHITETHNVKELVQYYSIADVFYNPSKEETFGKVTAEALACGTPVIVCDSTANPELVGDGCGYILADATVYKVVQVIERIRNNGKDYYSDNCIEFAKNNFSIQYGLKKYLETYTEISSVE